ncbi:MAG: phospholipase D family protein, partial [Deltaproteobacteria bacterium]|nr:phospholipase D family protein [Deltaproteobacteria bacterium]
MSIRHYVSTLCLNALALVFINGCATLPTNVDRPVSRAYTDTDDTVFGKIRRDEMLAHPGKSGFLLLGDGLDAFVARAILAQGAEKSLDAQYYLFHDDLVGALFIDLLLKAADRGVRVRLLVDDMALEGRDVGAAALDSHPNMEVRIFNPFSRKVGRLSQYVTRYGSVTRRMHNKSFTADNQATILGGRNIGDEYFEADPALSFADLDVLAIGPVSREVSASFDKYWNSELAYPALSLKGEPPAPEEIQEGRAHLDELIRQQAESPYLRALRDSNLARALRAGSVKFHWGEAEVVYDQPEKLLHDFSETEYHLAPRLAPYLDGIGEELIIFSPYFVPGKEGTAFLKDMSERGVRVRILTNSLASTDVGIVHAGYAKYRKDLLRSGVELYEMNKKLERGERKEKKGPHGSSKASLHAKSFIFDRRQVFIGSLNLDPRALLHNTEIGVVLTSVDMARDMVEWFEENIEKIAFRLELQADETGYERILWHGLEAGKPVVYTVDPHTGFWRRLGIGFMSLLPIESQ